LNLVGLTRNEYYICTMITQNNNKILHLPDSTCFRWELHNVVIGEGRGKGRGEGGEVGNEGETQFLYQTPLNTDSRVYYNEGFGVNGG